MKRKKKKSEHATVLLRVQEILTIRLLGAEWWDIRQYASEKKWLVSERQLRRYVAMSDELMAQNLEKDRDKLIGRHLASRRTLFAKAMETGDLRTALAVAKDEAELQALYPPTRTEHTGKGGGPIEQKHEHNHHISIDEFRALPVAERIRICRETMAPPSRN
jgi:hypothetical protein